MINMLNESYSTRTGTVVSNGRVGTKWTSSGNFISGFNNRVTSFDLNQVNSPPPLTPQTSDVYTLRIGGKGIEDRQVSDSSPPF